MKVLNFAPILKGGLAATVRLEMPSGFVLACNVLRARQDPSHYFVLPQGRPKHGGGFEEIVGFATEDLKRRWQDQALEAIRPRLAELAEPAREVPSDDCNNNVPF